MCLGVEVGGASVIRLAIHVVGKVDAGVSMHHGCFSSPPHWHGRCCTRITIVCRIPRWFHAAEGLCRLKTQ